MRQTLLFLFLSILVLTSCQKSETIDSNVSARPSGGGTSTSISSVKIGRQVWSSKNLDVSRYRNGDIIPQITDPTQWANLTTGAWCWYNNDSLNYSKYGKLYNWYSVNDPRGLSPQGWHISTDGEWNKLVKFVDPNADTTCDYCWQNTIAGKALKSSSGWNAGNNGTDNYGFTALPGGFRYSDGTFQLNMSIGYWWCSSEYSASVAWLRGLDGNSGVLRNRDVKNIGFSVRLVKN